MLPFLLFVFVLINQSINQCLGDYGQTIFASDGWGGSAFLYPQMTSACNSVMYAIYHYSVNGVDGQAGISLITDSGMNYRNFPIILPSRGNPSINPPYNFINDPFVAQSPYAADYMVCYHDDTYGMDVIEMTIPIETPINGGYQMQMVNLVIDIFGYYVRSWTTPSLQVSVPYQLTNQPMSQLTIQYVSATRMIIVGGINQPFMQTINLTQYWHHARGCMHLAADIKVINPTNPSTAALVVLVDDSTQAYPYIRQMILIINPYTGVLLDKIDTGITYDINQLVAAGRSQVTVIQDGRIMIVPPSSYNQRQVHRWGQIAPWSVLTAPNGYVEKVWFTNLGYLQGQTVLSDSTVVTTKISATDLTAHTISVVLTDPINQQVLSEFSTITGLTSQAIADGARASLSEYLFVAVSCDANDNLYLSNYYQNGYNQGRAPGVLIVTKTGEFIDWYPGFQLPQYVSFSREGYMLVPDRYGGLLHVINMTSRETVSTHVCDGCNGIAIDDINGGYVVTTHVTWQNSAKIQFMDNNFNYVYSLGNIPFTFYNGFSDQAALSNPVVDSQGRIYVLVSSQAGQARSTASLYVYNASTRSLILSHNWANPQPRGVPGVSQLNYGLSLSIDRNTQAIVAATIDFGQIFKTKPL